MITLKNVAEKSATKPSANGTETKNSVSKEETKLPMIAARETPTIEARLKKLEKLQELADRRDLLLTSLGKLEDFYIAPDGNSANLKLQDSTGKTFAIAHPTVIGEMVSIAKNRLTAELSKVESDFNFNI